MTPKTSHNGRGGGSSTSTAIWVGASLILVVLGTLAMAAAAPVASPPSSAFSSVPSPSAVAATPQEVLALSSSDCSEVYNVTQGGSAPSFTTLPTSANKCPEGAIAIAPGLGNYPAGQVYVLQNGVLFVIPANGSASGIAAVPLPSLAGEYPGLTFDYSGSFGYALLATGGKYGNVVEISPSNVPRNIGAFGATVEGPSVAPSSFQGFAGDLMVASEGHSQVYAMTPPNATGAVAVSTFAEWQDSEAVSFVPSHGCTLGSTGDSYFVADTSANAILAYPSSTFASLAGGASALILGEYKGAGVGVVGSAGGSATSFLPISGTLEGAAYVTCPVGVVQAIDLTSHGFDTQDGSGLNLIGFNPATGQLIGVDPTNAPSEIFVLNGATGAFEGNYSVGLNPSAVTYNPQTNVLFVANEGSSNVSLLNATNYQELGNISTGAGSAPIGLVYNGQNEKLYVASAGTNTTDVFSLVNNFFPNQNQITYLPGAPVALVVDPVDHNVYVVGNDGTTGQVWEFHAFALVDTAVLTGNASSIAVNTTSGLLYVTSPSANELVTLAAGDAFLQPSGNVTIPVPVGVAYDSQDGLVVVVSLNGNVSILAGGQIVATYVIGQDPGPLFYDPVSNLVYAAADVTVGLNDPRIILGGTA